MQITTELRYKATAFESADAFRASQLTRMDDYRLHECAAWGLVNARDSGETAFALVEQARRQQAGILTLEERRWCDNESRTLQAFSRMFGA